MKRATALATALALALSACGGGGDDAPSLTVSAASSLRAPLTDFADEYDAADVRLSFAGSDELAAQIRQGVKPDVFAAATIELPTALHAEGLVEQPVVFAVNRLVIAVPADSPAVRSVDDLGKPGVKLAIGSESVPIGDYTRELLGRLGEPRSRAILANVYSEEPDVKGVIGKLLQGVVDAGFVYATDVTAANGELEAIKLPDDLQPTVAYGVAVVKGAKNPDAAKRFVDGLVDGDGESYLRASGFELP